MEAELHAWLKRVLEERGLDDAYSYDICAEVLQRCSEIAAQAREQALLEAEDAIDAADYYIGEGYESVIDETISTAHDAIEALTTPTAQAEAVKRIVAEWLEEQLANARDRYNEKPNPDDDRRAGAATNLLAALKEQE